MSFPPRLSFTLTNACNLRCRMCGQWSETGYVRCGGVARPEMGLADWKRLVDEGAEHGVSFVLVRGGEPFLFPGIIELLEHLAAKGIATSVDTNGTMLERYAADLVRLGDNIELTVSVDGPEEVHDEVRGVPGCFRRMERGVAALRAAEDAAGKKLRRAICFTISPYSLRGLAEMPAVARRLGMPIHVVPYYYFPDAVGQAYEAELRTLGCEAFSWRGFHHPASGIDFDEFLPLFRRYQAGLAPDERAVFMDLGEEDYRTWFADATTPVGSTACWNLDGLLDIQPDGEANFCVDFPDYPIGNVASATIEALWNGARAERLREHRRRKPLAICHRCGAKYISMPR